MASSADEKAKASVQASRVGKANIAAWLPAEFQKNLSILKAYSGKDKDQLIADALNMLFKKNDISPVPFDKTK